MRRLTNGDAVRIKTEQAEYIATVERLQNDRNGNPRFCVTLICLSSESGGAFYCPRYNAKGYYNTQGIAEHVARIYEEETERAKK